MSPGEWFCFNQVLISQPTAYGQVWQGLVIGSLWVKSSLHDQLAVARVPLAQISMAEEEKMGDSSGQVVSQKYYGDQP